MLKTIAKGLRELASTKIGGSASRSRGSAEGIPSILKALDKVPVHVSQGVTAVLSEFTDYLKIAEVETTKRADILARRDVALLGLQNQRAAFEQLMTLTFQERAAVIQKQFDVLDIAMQKGDLTTIKNALDGMVSVIQSSPFKSVSEMQAALGSKDFVVRLE